MMGEWLGHRKSCILRMSLRKTFQSINKHIECDVCWMQLNIQQGHLCVTTQQSCHTMVTSLQKKHSSENSGMWCMPCGYFLFYTHWIILYNVLYDRYQFLVRYYIIDYAPKPIYRLPRKYGISQYVPSQSYILMLYKQKADHVSS